jgi:hypothetical protein
MWLYVPPALQHERWRRRTGHRMLESEAEGVPRLFNVDVGSRE